MLGGQHPKMLLVLSCPRVTHRTMVQFRVKVTALIRKYLLQSPLWFKHIRLKKNTYDLCCVNPIYTANTQRIILTCLL